MLGLFFKNIDKIICKYLGIEANDVEHPKAVKVSKSKILICKNHLFQRHRYYEHLFQKNDHHSYSDEMKDKIGFATGRAIANNLIVSFQEIKIKC